MEEQAPSSIGLNTVISLLYPKIDTPKIRDEKIVHLEQKKLLL
jgi:hypothetical protein